MLLVLVQYKRDLHTQRIGWLPFCFVKKIFRAQASTMRNYPRRLRPLLNIGGWHDSLLDDCDSISKEGNCMAKKPAPAPQPATVTLKHLAAELAERHELSKKQAEAVLSEMVALATRHLRKGDRLRFAGLGILQVRKRAARMGRNPATGEAIKIKASKKVAFRAAKDLRESI
jgi:DNA-binding protein HU-beta